ncbi:MAG: hypothetical protein ACLRZ7_11740 [Lachnospiraceae bacterium]
MSVMEYEAKIRELEITVAEFKLENARLKKDVDWMHEMIWHMIHKIRKQSAQN